jgi:hypothetical protein
MAATRQRASSKIDRPRALEGLAVGISVAESDDLAAHGYTAEDVNRVTVRLSEALLGAGARLWFGHDWRPDGVMEAICCIAVKYQPLRTATGPLIHNLLPWPDQPALDPEIRRDLEQRGIMKVETAGLPESPWSAATDKTARAVALTHLRRELTEVTDARICIGGKEQSAQGFYAGIIEEAYYAVMAGRPLYVGSFLGGAAARLVDVIEHPERADKIPALSLLAEKQQAYKAVRSKAPALAPPGNLAEAFESKTLQGRSGLSRDDWKKLLTASDVDTFAALVIRGLRQAAPRRASASQVVPNPKAAAPLLSRPPKRRGRLK